MLKCETQTMMSKGKQIVPAKSKGWFWNSGYIHLWEAPLPLSTSAKNSFC